MEKEGYKMCDIKAIDSNINMDLIKYRGAYLVELKSFFKFVGGER
jgi:hypothetical protein